MTAWLLCDQRSQCSFLNHTFYSIWTAQYLFAVLVDVYGIVRGKRSDVMIFIDFNDTAFFLIYIVFNAVILWGLLNTKPKFERS